jgi:hypothetical protein
MLNRTLEKMAMEAIAEVVTLPEAEARAAAEKLAVILAQKIPPQSRAELQKRIMSEFDGRNHVTLIRKYGISRSTLYRILAQ